MPHENPGLPYKGLGDLRLYKPNDPYYFEVDNLPLLDLLGNTDYLKVEIDNIFQELSGFVTRSSMNIDGIGDFAGNDKWLILGNLIDIHESADRRKTSIENGMVLMFDTGTNKWKAGFPVNRLDNLTDVAILNDHKGAILSRAQVDSAGNIRWTNVGESNGVVGSPPQAGQVLQYIENSDRGNRWAAMDVGESDLQYREYTTCANTGRRHNQTWDTYPSDSPTDNTSWSTWVSWPYYDNVMGQNQYGYPLGITILALGDMIIAQVYIPTNDWALYTSSPRWRSGGDDHRQWGGYLYFNLSRMGFDNSLGSKSAISMGFVPYAGDLEEQNTGYVNTHFPNAGGRKLSPGIGDLVWAVNFKHIYDDGDRLFPRAQIIGKLKPGFNIHDGDCGWNIITEH